MNRWYALEGAMMFDLLTRAGEGEDPEMLMMELYANSTTETVEGYED